MKRLRWKSGRALLIAPFLLASGYLAQETQEATLIVRVIDATNGRGTPARVRLEDGQGNRPHVRGAVAVSDSAIPIPRQAIAVMWGQNDRAQGYALQPDGSFYADGGFDVRVPPGAYKLTVSKGFEYVEQSIALDLAAGSTLTREVRLARWIDMPSRGWYSSDDHIHLRRSPGDDPNILRWIAAEDVHVGNILEMGDFWARARATVRTGSRPKSRSHRLMAFGSPRNARAAPANSRTPHLCT